MHVACYQGHTDIARTLLAAGADLHAATAAWNNDRVKPTVLYLGDAWTGQPLRLTSMAGNSDIAKIQVENDVDIHASTGVDTASFDCPGHGPTVFQLVLDPGTFYYQQGKALTEARLQIAQWLVRGGPMVQRVIRKPFLQDILQFRKFPDLWDALVAGDSLGDVPSQNPTSKSRHYPRLCESVARRAYGI